MKLSEIQEDTAPAQGAPTPAGTKLSQVDQPSKEEGAGATPSMLGAMFKGFLHGGAMMGRGVEQAAQHMPSLTGLGEAGRQRIAGQSDAGVQQSEQQYQASPERTAHPIASGIGRAGGEMAATLPLSLATGGAGIPARLAAGAATGAMGGAAQPVTGGDYLAEKTKQVATGGAVGGALGTAGRMIGPPLSEAAQSAIDKFPHIASLIKGTAARSPDNFNRSMVSQALDPLGITAPKNMKAGHDLINFGGDRLTDAYNKVLPPLTAKVDQQLSKEVAALKTYTGQMAEDKHSQLVKFIESHFEAPILAKGGVLDGQMIKGLESRLGKKAAAYSKSPDADQQELGGAIYDLREHMMDAVTRQNPAAAPALKNVNLSYAMFSRLRDASVRKADSGGVFTPLDVLNESRKAGRGSFKAGDGLMQAAAEATKGPMSKDKANRLIYMALGGAAEATGHNMGVPGAGVALGAAGPEIAKGAVRATQHPASRAVGRGVSGLAPEAGSIAARMKASRKVGEIQTKLYAAKRKGDLDEVQKLTRDLSGAQSDYKALQPRQ